MGEFRYTGKIDWLFLKLKDNRNFLLVHSCGGFSGGTSRCRDGVGTSAFNFKKTLIHLEKVSVVSGCRAK